MLIGVIAHETGHIAGGHILRSLEAVKNASIETIIAMAARSPFDRRRQRRPDDRRGRCRPGRVYELLVSQEATADHAALNYLEPQRPVGARAVEILRNLQADEPLSGEATIRGRAPIR